LALKKSLLLYFITLPNLNVIADIFYFPESILEDTKFFFSISSFLIQKNIKIGLSISTQSIHTPQNLENPLDYLSNPLQLSSHIVLNIIFIRFIYQFLFVNGVFKSHLKMKNILYNPSLIGQIFP